MSGRFSYKSFADLDLDDAFFSTLKSDYPGNENSTGFIDWFNKKKTKQAEALTFEDEQGIAAFIYVKQEHECIKLKDSMLPAIPRTKIGTFRISERYRRQRIGEGALGLILWGWQQTDNDEIYVTVFDKHDDLISLFIRFGFIDYGYNCNNEKVLIKKRANNCISPYSSFPFLCSDFSYAGYIIVEDNFHDNMFAYSDLANTVSLQSEVIKSVSNGLSKIYIGKFDADKYYIGEPVLIYRKYTKGEGKIFRSCITSFCVITKAYNIKKYGKYHYSKEEFVNLIGNKSVFDKDELNDLYEQNKVLSVVEMLYYGYFGAGNNVNLAWLKQNSCWSAEGQYPTDVHLSPKQFYSILNEGSVNVSHVIIN